MPYTEPDRVEIISDINIDGGLYNYISNFFGKVFRWMTKAGETVLAVRHNSVKFHFLMSATSWHRLSTIALFQPGLLAGIGILEFRIVDQPEVFDLRVTYEDGNVDDFTGKLAKMCSSRNAQLLF